MKAIVYERYGPPEVLQLRDVPTPSPGAGEVRIRTRATTVTAGDWRVRSLDVPRGFRSISRLIFGISRPRQPILGTELAGDVEALGPGVTKFRIGDPVFLYSSAEMGCYAEYKCMPEDGPIARKPDGLSYEEAAALPFGGATALHFLRAGGIAAGQNVLVNGASGGVGTAAVQLARHFGANVTGVCGPSNLELVESLGAQKVIDYTREDFTESADKYDIIVDTAGTAPYARSKRALTPTGCLLIVLGGLSDMLLAPLISATTRRTVVAGPAPGRREDVVLLAELASAGEFRPYIDRTYPCEQIVEAHRYVDTGRKRGNVVVTWDRSAGTS